MSIVKISIIVALTVLHEHLASFVDLDKRMYNGKDLENTYGKDKNRVKRPFFVQVNKHDTPTIFCGGVLVKPTVIVTAASCLNLNGSRAAVDVNVKDFTLKTDLNSNPLFTFPSRTAYQSPDYNEKTGDHDIAIIVLNDTDIQDSRRKVLPLCDKESEYSKFSMSGLGYTDLKPKPRLKTESYMDTLHEIEMSPEPNLTLCENDKAEKVNSRTRVKDNQANDRIMCFRGFGHKGACVGDIGGPIYNVDENNKATCIHGIITKADSTCRYWVRGLRIEEYLKNYLCKFRITPSKKVKKPRKNAFFNSEDDC